MHLREGCGTERRRIDAGEHLAYGAAIFLRQRVDDDLIRHRVGIGAQLRELVAKRLRQNLRPHGQYLPDLDECGAQRLQHQPHLHRSEAVHHVELVRDAHDLSEALDFPAPRQVISTGKGVAMIVEQPDGGRPVPFAAFAGTSRHDTVFRRTVRPRCGFPPFRIMPWVAGMAARGIGRHGVLLRHAKQRSLPPGKDLRRRHRHRSAPWRPQSFPRPSPWPPAPCA